MQQRYYMMKIAVEKMKVEQMKNIGENGWNVVVDANVDVVVVVVCMFM